MKLATGILILGLGLGSAGAQNPSIIDSTKAKLNAVQQQKTADSNAALGISHGQSGTAQTSSSTKPAVAPAKPVAAKPAANATPVAHVAAQTQPASKPAVPVVNKPAVATANQKAAPVASKQSVPVASQKAAPTAGKQPVAAATAPKAAAKAAPAVPTAAPKTAAKTATPETKDKAAAAGSKNKKKATTAVSVKKSEPAKSAVAVEDKKNPDPKKEEHKTISMAGGRRDPFLSPVVNRSMGGSGCSTGKRCLAVDQIALQGIVKSDAGMIAVVVNAMNKAYFLRENDPVFNGYVVKITGDSIVFKETLQDKLGKPFTREVTKKISTPAV